MYYYQCHSSNPTVTVIIISDRTKCLIKFVYITGNICRSPIAEGVFQKTVNDMNLGNQWEIDSAAIGGWHVGNTPDWRALDTMKKHDVPYSNHARQVIFWFTNVRAHNK